MCSWIPCHSSNLGSNQHVLCRLYVSPMPWLIDAVFKDFLVTTHAVVARFVHLKQNVHQQLLPVTWSRFLSMRERLWNMIMICSLFLLLQGSSITHMMDSCICGYTLAVGHNYRRQWWNPPTPAPGQTRDRIGEKHQVSLVVMSGNTIEPM